MKPHVLDRIPAYHDGELTAKEKREIEAHLATCPDCQAELDQLRLLSRLLQGVPAPLPLTTVGLFTRQVMRRLRQKTNLPAWQRFPRLAWQFAPVGIIAAWAFIQAGLWCSKTILLALPLTSLGEYLPSNSLPTGVITMAGIALLDLRGLLGESLPWIETIRTIFQFNLLNLVFALLTGIALWGWLASWWIFHQKRTEFQEG